MFVICRALIFESSVWRGIPSLVAAPDGPEILPLALLHSGFDHFSFTLHAYSVMRPVTLIERDGFPPRNFGLRIALRRVQHISASIPESARDQECTLNFRPSRIRQTAKGAADTIALRQ